LARDERYWNIDSDLFYPERFQGEDKTHHPYAFIPFEDVHQPCVGQYLAGFELKFIAARLM
jgi:cytochrome P450